MTLRTMRSKWFTPFRVQAFHQPDGETSALAISLRFNKMNPFRQIYSFWRLLMKKVHVMLRLRTWTVKRTWSKNTQKRSCKASSTTKQTWLEHSMGRSNVNYPTIRSINSKVQWKLMARTFHYLQKTLFWEVAPYAIQNTSWELSSIKVTTPKWWWTVQKQSINSPNLKSIQATLF